jgi:hypothetical protein
MIYHAISLLTEPMDLHVSIIRNKELTQIILSKIDDIFGNIKKNEITNKMIQQNMKKVNFEKSMKKLSIVSDVDYDFTDNTDNK